jgi:hypothetical protein
VSGVEAAKLIAPGAAKLATQEAAKVIALLVESAARLLGRDLGAPLIGIALGDDVLDARRQPN